MAHLTLEQRCRIIQQRFHMPKFSKFALRSYYRMHGIRYLKPSFQYRSKMEKQDEVRFEQMTFSKDLTEIMMAERQCLIYVDETTVHRWMIPRYAWCRPGQYFTLPENRGSSLTIIGAVSKQHGLIYYQIIEGSNNKETFYRFTQGLLSRAPARCMVIMDNLSVHKATAVKGLFKGEQRQVFLPPYSSTLNPIERLWNLLKVRWKNEILRRGQIQMTDEDAKFTIHKIMTSFTKRQINGVIVSHHNSLAQSIRGQLV